MHSTTWVSSVQGFWINYYFRNNTQSKLNGHFIFETGNAIRRIWYQNHDIDCMRSHQFLHRLCLLVLFSAHRYSTERGIGVHTLIDFVNKLWNDNSPKIFFSMMTANVGCHYYYIILLVLILTSQYTVKEKEHLLSLQI